jgi:hypothetical protein
VVEKRRTVLSKSRGDVARKVLCTYIIISKQTDSLKIIAHKTPPTSDHNIVLKIVYFPKITDVFKNNNYYYYSFFFQKRLYQSVIDDVILNIKDTFIDEGVDEQVFTIFPILKWRLFFEFLKQNTRFNPD